MLSYISKGILKGLLVVMCLSSCSYLDKKPDNLLTEDLVWSTRKQAEAYLYQVYAYSWMATSDGATFLGISEESYITIPGVAARKINDGNWSPAATVWDCWTSAYQGIRASILFEQNVDKVPASEMSDAMKTQYKAEVRFLRGWFYWNLLKSYGPFVKLTTALATNEDFNAYPRAPFDTCVAYINELMDQAAPVLPLVQPSSWDGKPTRGTCLAIKSEATLLAASPLWNGNPDFANFRNKDGQALAPAKADPDKWKAAAAAAKAVIDLGQYKLFTNEDEGQTFDPYLSYRDLFLSNWNKELIFSWSNWRWSDWEHDCSPLPGGFQLFAATQNVVDAYYMNDGKWITDPSSGYKETGFAQTAGTATGSHAAGDWNMYANREPRFYVSILYNRRPVTPAPSADDKNRYSSPGNADGTGRIEFYYNGFSGRKLLGNDFPGYLISKNISPAANAYAWNGPYRPAAFLRYAQILLNYVEALNEADPSNTDIPKYLDMVRTRAGIPGIATVYPDAIGKQEQMRAHIQRERYIELAFEQGDHWFTSARRKAMDNDSFKKIYGMNVGADDGGQGFNFTGFYTRTLLQQRYFDKKMYVFPIPQGEMNKDTALVQNPGW